MAQIGDDCYFFYNQSCNKGPACNFRHVEEAKGNEIICQDWSLGRCSEPLCPFRHSEPPKTRQAVPCYYESQPGGCTRVDCPFAHQFPKPGPPGGAPMFGLGPPVTVPPNVRPGWVPPVHHAPPPGAPPTSIHNWIPPQGPPVTRPGFMPPPGPGLPFGQFPPAPQDAMYIVDQSGDKMMPMVEPVIISLNSEESDQESMKGGSPQKSLSRTIVAPAPVKSDNPLDYFLNAKRWVDPRWRRSPSPKRSSPVRSRSRSPVRSRSRSPVRSRSRSPRGPSPARSLSPVGRRRSVSVDRQFRRQRSDSLDRSRSQSPDARDRRRFVRRLSRSPPRRRSRSPGPYRGRPAHQDLRSKLKPQVPKEPKLAEVKVTGPKIISIKKDKKEEEVEKTEEQTEKPKEETDAKGFVQDEVKSLEDIYRERALKSLMDAKRKRIMEQKKKRWETVGEKGEKTSESESVKSDTEKPTTEEAENTADEKTADEKTADEQSESEDSEADLADDVDVEIDAGDLSEEEPEEEESESGKSHEESASEEERNGKTEAKQVKDCKAKSSVAKVKPANKPSIKSRLGLKAVEQITKQASKDRVGAKHSRARSIKDRLGLKASDDSAPVSHNVRSGVIRLSKSSSDLSSKIRDVRDIRARKSDRSRDKKLMLLPHITIKNNVEQRRAGIKQRLGLLDDEDSYRKRNDMDEELLKLLQEDDTDIEEEDIRLLTKKEKKRLLKKLLIEHGREDEYDMLKKRKKKGRRRERDEEEDWRRERDEEEDWRRERIEEDERRRDRDEVNRRRERDDGNDRSKRRINVRSRLGPSPVPETRDSEEEADDQLDSGEEIELAEEDQEPENEETKENSEVEAEPDSSNTKENVPSSDNDPELEKLSEEKLREKAQKLKEALEPKSLADIRKERAEKKSRGEIDGGSRKGRRILLAEDLEDTSPPINDLPVKVTFGDEDARRRIGQRASIWSSRDRQEKSAKRERQIYVPPTLKRAEGPTIVTQKASISLKRAAEPPTGRDIVDYRDMFSKKTTPIDTALEPRAKTIKLARAAEPVPEVRAPLRMQRGPPKVEVKDATVKTFAEIMAEKKRKRQLAQQENNPNRKPFTPISFDEPEISSQDSTTSEKPSSNIKSRLSPFEDASSNDSNSQSFKSESLSSSPSKLKSISSSVSSSVTISAPKKTSTEETLPGKPTRWKRRKTNPDVVPCSVPHKDNEVLKTQEKIPPVSTDNTSVPKIFPRVEKKTLPSVETKILPSVEKKTLSSVKTETVEKVVLEKVVQRKPSEETATAAKPVKSKVESSPATEKQTSLSDSFLDLDDDFLNMDDGDLDLDLDANQDHDTLMAEIDELLA